MDEKESKLNIITIGYAKRALVPSSREYLRMKQYASVLGELHVIVFSDSSEDFPPIQQDGNLFLYATNSRTKVGKIFSAIKIGKKIIKEQKGLDWIVSSQDPFETSLVRGAVAGGNRTTNHVQIHGDVFNPHSSKSSILQRLRTSYGRLVVKEAFCIRVVSERIKNSLIRMGVKPEVITVLPIQADLQSFIKVGEDRTYNPENNLSFLYVGRFSEEKNLPLLIRSFAKATKEFPQANLTLLGDGPIKSLISSEIHRLDVKDNIKLLSWTDDVANVMSKHDILCLASNHEGWAMVLVEAAAAGMSVITTDVGCAGELIKDGIQGRVVSVGSESEYTKAITQYLSNPDLVSQHGQSGHILAKSKELTEEQYLRLMVESWSSCQH